jgi:hypothetical protein
MKKILISEDAFGDLNDGFLLYEAQEFGLGDYFTSCLRADIEGLRITAGIHREVLGFHRLLSRVFPHGIFYTVHPDHVMVLAVIDLRRNPDWIKSRLKQT